MPSARAARTKPPSSGTRRNCPIASTRGTPLICVYSSEGGLEPVSDNGRVRHSGVCADYALPLSLTVTADPGSNRAVPIGV
jgi:hypothetical protein